MKNMTPAELARLGIYLIGAAAGAVLIVIGAVRGDAALIAAGAGLLTTGSIAAPNVTRTRSE